MDPTDQPADRKHRQLKLDTAGLLPAIVQDASSQQVLMLAWMDSEALRRTLATRRATYWSRSRRTYWVKGETSGHVQHVRSVRLDCDGDTVLLTVDQHGPACHTGAATCFDDAPLLDTSLLDPSLLDAPLPTGTGDRAGPDEGAADV
jgi:phosphoribosyl-AMP cyclohydrolase